VRLNENVSLRIFRAQGFLVRENDGNERKIVERLEKWHRSFDEFCCWIVEIGRNVRVFEMACAPSEKQLVKEWNIWKIQLYCEKCIPRFSSLLGENQNEIRLKLIENFNDFLAMAMISFFSFKIKIKISLHTHIYFCNF